MRGAGDRVQHVQVVRQNSCRETGLGQCLLRIRAVIYPFQKNRLVQQRHTARREPRHGAANVGIDFPGVVDMQHHDELCGSWPPEGADETVRHPGRADHRQSGVDAHSSNSIMSIKNTQQLTDFYIAIGQRVAAAQYDLSD